MLTEKYKYIFITENLSLSFPSASAVVDCNRIPYKVVTRKMFSSLETTGRTLCWMKQREDTCYTLATQVYPGYFDDKSSLWLQFLLCFGRFHRKWRITSAKPPSGTRHEQTLTQDSCPFSGRSWKIHHILHHQQATASWICLVLIT